jgi:hypothetical protein
MFEERAASRERCGYSRAEANRLARDELENLWHLQHGERVPRDLCAGCRKPIGDAASLDLIDGNRVHLTDRNGCLVQHGNRWRANAARALDDCSQAEPGGAYRCEGIAANGPAAAEQKQSDRASAERDGDPRAPIGEPPIQAHRAVVDGVIHDIPFVTWLRTCWTVKLGFRLSS